MKLLGQIPHGYYHDLESAYRVILRMILRHVEHNLGEDDCEVVLTYCGSNQTTVRMQQRLTLRKGVHGHNFTMTNNASITELMQEVKTLVRSHCDHDNDAGPVSTYDVVHAIVDKVLAPVAHTVVSEENHMQPPRLYDILDTPMSKTSRSHRDGRKASHTLICPLNEIAHILRRRRVHGLGSCSWRISHSRRATRSGELLLGNSLGRTPAR